MRLNEIRIILKQAIDDMTGVKGTGNNIKIVSNYLRALNALKRIEPLEIANSNIEKLKQRGLIYLGADNPKMASNDVEYLVQEINLVIAKCEGAVQIIEKQIPQEKKESLAVKLPSSNNYETFVYTNNQFNKALKLLECLPELEKKPDLSNLDVGSGWIVICFSAYAGLYLFEKIIETVNKYRQSKVSKRLADLRLSEVAVNLEIKQQYQKALLDETTKDFKELAQKLTEATKKETLEPENLTSISKAMQIIADIMDSGVSFHQSVLTDKEDEKILPSEDDQNLFSKEKQKLVQQLLLEHKID